MSHATMKGLRGRRPAPVAIVPIGADSRFTYRDRAAFKAFKAAFKAHAALTPLCVRSKHRGVGLNARRIMNAALNASNW